MKKTIAALLALIVCFFSLSAPVLAAGTEENTDLEISALESDEFLPDEEELSEEEQLLTVEDSVSASESALLVSDAAEAEEEQSSKSPAGTESPEAVITLPSPEATEAGQEQANEAPADIASSDESDSLPSAETPETQEEQPSENPDSDDPAGTGNDEAVGDEDEQAPDADIDEEMPLEANAPLTAKVEIDFSSMRNGWNYVSGNWYYVRSGAAVTGWLKSGGKWYYLDPNNDGAMATGWVNVEDDSRYYLNESGIMKTGWVYDDSTWYYLKSSGRLQTGWLKNSGKWYYLDPEQDGAMQTGWMDIEDDGRYYMNTSGVMQTGWVYDDSTWYYMNSSGRLRTGWLKTGSVWTSKWYYLDPEQDGAMQTGWTDVGDSRYYMNTSGVMQTGWLSSRNNWYYLTVTGRMATGWMYLGSSDYYFYTADDDVSTSDIGTMAYSTEIAGRAIGADGKAEVPAYDGTLSKSEVITNRAQYYSSRTSNLLLLDRSSCKLYVFEGQQNSWDLMHTWSCSPGNSSSPTPSGTFVVQDKGYYFDSGSSRCFWWTQFYGSYCMHSILYYQNGTSPSSATVMNSSLGYRISHGCVRLSTNNAYWVYNNIGQGTTVVIY